MAKPEKLQKREYEALAAFRHALREFIHFSEEAAQKVGLTPQQHQALLAIKGFPARDGITVGELAGWLQLRPHSVVGLVDRMVAEKLVVRAASEHDGRQVLVHLAPRGENILAKLSAIHRQELKRIAPGLSRLLSHFKTTGK